MPSPEAPGKWTLLLPIAICVAGCAGAGSSATGGRAEPDPIVKRAELLGARGRAPQLWAEAEAASLKARALQGEARAELVTEARLWREAAVAEAERQDLQARAETQTRRAEGDAQRLLAVRIEREALEDEAERLGAGRLALEEAIRVRERAATEPRRRPQLSPDAVRAGARALLMRAERVLAAARNLEAAKGSLDAAVEQLESAAAALERQPERALGLADRALFDALAALAGLRAEEVDAAARQSLAEALREAGYATVRTDLGLTAARAFPDPWGALNGRPLARLCKLRGAFAVGALQVTLRDPQPARARKLAPALGARFGQLGCDAGPVLTQAAPEGQAPVLEVSFLAY